MWSLSNAFTSALKRRSHSAIQGDGQVGTISEPVGLWKGRRIATTKFRHSVFSFTKKLSMADQCVSQTIAIKPESNNWTMVLTTPSYQVGKRKFPSLWSILTGNTIVQLRGPFGSGWMVRALCRRVVCVTRATISDRSSKFLRLSSVVCAFALASLRFFDRKASAQHSADRRYRKFFGSNLTSIAYSLTSRERKFWIYEGDRDILDNPTPVRRNDKNDELSNGH
jgi:hypothetical protein